MKSTIRNRLLATAVSAALLTASGGAVAADAFTTALVSGTPWVDMRYRLETVDQDNLLRDATASTLRTRLGYRTGDFQGLSALIEFSSTQVVGDERYHSGPTGNDKTEFSTVVDPKVSRFNQQALIYGGLPDTQLTLGRQRIIFDNARFIGNVGFRQQEQTFDALRVTNGSLPDTTINYVYIDRVNRIFRDNDDKGVRHHLLNVNYAGLRFGTLVGYGYWLDYRESAPQSSTRTLGLRFSGAQDIDAAKLLYAAEFARQEDHGKFVGDYSADYYLLELGATFQGITFRLGQEVLGSDAGAKGFETRLATLHAHNGWADLFLVTPADGLRDRYLSVGGTVVGVSLLGIYRDYRSDRGSVDYGSEWGLMARYAFNTHYAVEAKYADYSADQFGVDTRKLWLSAELRF